METSPESTPMPSSKAMLGYIIAVVVPVMLLLQLVVFLFFRWESVVMYDMWSGRVIDWSLSPWVVWLPIGMASLLGIWIYSCRKEAARWQKMVLIVSVVVSIGIAVFGLTLEPPAAIMPSPDSKEGVQNILNGPPILSNPFRFKH